MIGDTPTSVNPCGSDAARLDACPSCAVNTEVPFGTFTLLNGSTVCMYHCADCGHRWHTSWISEAVA
jgi:hypothetical protein